MNFDTNLIKVGQELRMLWTIEYFNIGGMGAAISIYLMRFHKSSKIYFKSCSSYKFGLFSGKWLPVTIIKHMLNTVVKYFHPVG